MFNKISMKKAWIFILITTGIVPVVVLLFWYSNQDFDRRLDSIMWRETAFNRELKESIWGEVKRHITVLQNKSDAMAHILLREEREQLVGDFIDKILNREPAIHGLLLVSTEDQILAAYDNAPRSSYNYKMLNPKGISDSDWLELHWEVNVDEASRSPELVIPLHGRKYIGNLHLHEGRNVFTIAVPVGELDHPVAILLAEVDLEILWQSRQFKEGNHYVNSYLVDRRGDLATKVPDSQYSVGDLISHVPIVRSALGTGEWSHNQTYDSLNGQPVYATMTRIPLLSWTVISEIPKEIITAPIVSAQRNMLIVIFLMYLSATGLGLWLLQYLLLPIKQIANAMGDFSAGNKNVSIPVSSIVEYDVMGTAFSSMVIQLNQAKDELESKVFERTKALNETNRQLIQAKDKADIANRAKSNFLSSMSHEIRTPMTGVLGITELLKETDLNEVQIQYIRTIERSGKTLMTVINDILDYSKVEAGKLELEVLPFDLANLIKETVTPYQLAQDDYVKMITVLESDVPQRLKGDAVRLHQIITNLLSNAFKFTRKGTVTLRLSFEQWQGGRAFIRFCISDTGIGIDEKVKASLFESFTQADQSTARKFGGTGLGLTICKGLVELMGGVLEIESELTKGSDFFFTIGFDVEEELSIDPVCGKKKINYSQLKILLVEDNPVNQLVAKGLMGKLGVDLCIVSSGAEAVDLVCKKRCLFDLILMDCEMPEMDGYTATHKIREWEQAGDIAAVPIYALTAHVLQEHKRKCRVAGMDGHVAKPFDFEKLNETIDSIADNTLLPRKVNIDDKKRSQ